MKKALIALAVLGAASGAAVAQSSVTLYGVADIAIGKARSGGDSKWGAQTNTIVTNGNSRIGLTGKEDLGGGLWAGFKYEGHVNLASGHSSGVNPTANGATWARAAYLALGSNSFGTVMLGRNYSPGFDGVGTYELTGLANYSVVANTFGFGAYPDPRSNAQIEYRTPDIYGLTAEVAYVPKAEGVLIGQGGQPADNGVNNRTDLWAMNIAYDGTKSNIPVKAAFTINKPNHTAVGGVANKANWSLGGSYTFNTGSGAPSFVVAASYHHANNAMTWRYSKSCAAQNVYLCGGGGTPQWGVKRYGWELGGSVLAGPFTVTLDLTRDTKNQVYGDNKKYTNGVLEGKYAVSKRTFLYADYLRLDGDNNFGLGVRHNF